MTRRRDSFASRRDGERPATSAATWLAFFFFYARRHIRSKSSHAIAFQTSDAQSDDLHQRAAASAVEIGIDLLLKPLPVV